jgi:tetraprenyl-beta-curcumene synthase
MSDPLPLSPRQVWALVVAATRELLWGLKAVSREIDLWRTRALTIPDAPIREDALSSIDRKRGHTDGAALFWILPPRRDLNLLRLLVTYELIWDFLDSLNEHGACTLVESCRSGCALLPSYGRVRPYVLCEAERAQVLALNHDTDPSCRDEALKAWAARECSDERRLTWFELSGAASASMTIHAFLALAAQRACTDDEVRQTRAVYFPWMSAATTMLDSYVDQAEDELNGDHRYISHYADEVLAGDRVRDLVTRSAREARRLRNGHRHAVIAACMVAMYLSKDSARTPEMRASTASIVHAGGTLTRLLLPILRIWRIAFAQRSA